MFAVRSSEFDQKVRLMQVSVIKMIRAAAVCEGVAPAPTAALTLGSRRRKRAAKKTRVVPCRLS